MVQRDGWMELESLCTKAKADVQQLLEMRDGEYVTHEICVSCRLGQDQQFSAQRAVAPGQRTPKY